MARWLKLNIETVRKFLNDESIKPEWNELDIKKIPKYAYFPVFVRHFYDTYADPNFETKLYEGGKRSKMVSVNRTPDRAPENMKHNGFEFFLDVESYRNTLQSYKEAQRQAQEKYRQTPWTSRHLVRTPTDE